MTRFARFVCLVVLAFWVGGILFFGAVEAPALFRHATQQDAGAVVASSLHQLHRAGMVGGGILLLLLLLFPRIMALRTRVAASVLAAAMLITTAGLNWMIQSRMEPIRRAAPGRDVSALRADDPQRVAFDRMHARSTQLESVVLLAGFGVLFCFAWSPRETS